MYELKKASILAVNNLIDNLSTHGYRPVLDTIGIWQHTTRRTKFCLCVDNFVNKYYSKEDAQYLLDSLQENYTYTVD